MKSNAGGQIDPESAIGRDELIEHLWDTLESQSIVITAERRIGKTTVLRRMTALPQPHWKPVFQDLESHHSALEFAQSVYQVVDGFLGSGKRAVRRAREVFEKLGGTEVAGVLKLPNTARPAWKDLLTSSIEDLVGSDVPGRERLVFLWDEFPFMLANIRDRESPPVAMEVLDTLRCLRQSHRGLRMILTGSIGVHHVLAALRNDHYSNAPFNDMAKVDVPPFSRPDAIRLARELIKGEGLSSPDPDATAGRIAIEADGFPFYIHHIVKALRLANAEATPDTVARLVQAHLVDANDPWELQHFSQRISTYYGKDAKAVRAILDELSVAKDPPSLPELHRQLQGRGRFGDREKLGGLLLLLERDHYLQRQLDGRPRFRFEIIRRWWRLHHGLE